MVAFEYTVYVYMSVILLLQSCCFFHFSIITVYYVGICSYTIKALQLNTWPIFQSIPCFREIVRLLFLAPKPVSIYRRASNRHTLRWPFFIFSPQKSTHVQKKTAHHMPISSKCSPCINKINHLATRPSQPHMPQKMGGRLYNCRVDTMETNQRWKPVVFQ